MANNSYGLAANASYGLSYLDLPGNRYVWSPNDRNHTHVVLVGSQFHDSILITTFAISALSLLGLIAVIVAACSVVGRHKGVSQYLPWATVWLPIFWMIVFFGIGIGNRILHELQDTMPWPYIALDVGLVVSSATADSLLMVYLLRTSPVDVKRKGRIAFLGMFLGFAGYALLSVGTIGSQIWNVFQQSDADNFGSSPGSDTSSKYVVITSSGSEDGNSNNDDLNWSLVSQKLYQILDTAANGMLLLFAIAFGIVVIVFIRRQSEEPASSRRIRFAVGVLAASFVIRDAIRFIFTLLFAQYNSTASTGTQLIYMIFNGVLSVVLYSAIVWVASVMGREDVVNQEPRYQEHSPIGYTGAVSPQQKLYTHVRYNVSSPSDYSQYYHSPERQRQFYRQ